MNKYIEILLKILCLNSNPNDDYIVAEKTLWVIN